jgi:hypothetical protein
MATCVLSEGPTSMSGMWSSFGLRPHEVGKARATDELVHHAGRDERGIAGDGRGRVVEGELGG